MIIRPATLEDAAILAELNTHVQRLHFDRRPEIFKPPVASQAIVQFFHDALSDPNNVIYIAEVDDRAVGYVYCKVRLQPDNPFIYRQEVVLVDQLSVNPEHRGQGYGRLLMEEAFEFARSKGLARVVLDVWAFNDDALGFYRRLGMTIYNEKFEILLD